MSGSILQGTTPTLVISIDPDDLLLDTITELELVFQQGRETPIIKHLIDCEIDTTENTVTYHFTEEETLSFLRTYPLKWQIRFVFPYGDIVGTKIEEIEVVDLISKEILT